MGLPLPDMAAFWGMPIYPKVDWDKVRYAQYSCGGKPIKCTWCRRAMPLNSKFTLFTVDNVEYASCRKNACATRTGSFATASVVRILKERQLEKKLLVTRRLSIEIMRRLLKESPNRPVEIKV